jgi:carbon monoxide dehydrogenase subunit G
MHGGRLLGLALALIASPMAAQDFKWHGSLKSGQTLEVRGINGAIHATRASGSEAVVTATKRAHRSDPAEVEIKVVEHSDGVTICAVYPSRRASQPNECRPDGEGRNETRNNDTEVTFEVQVPAGVELVAGTVNGDVTARALPGNARVSTVNGDVEVEAGGVADASTVNGSISAELGRADWDDRLRFKTVNGGITVSLPGSLSADVEASTVNGAVESDFPITMTGRLTPRALRGRIGAGGRDLDLTTVNGRIRLRKTS